MNKILIFAGIILLSVLLLSTWFFIGEVGNFAQFLGQKSQEIVEGEENKFIGTWETTGGPTLKLSSDGTASNGLNNGIYEIKEGKLVITYSNLNSWDEDIYTYDYSFSNNDETLILTDINTEETTTYTKKQLDS